VNRFLILVFAVALVAGCNNAGPTPSAAKPETTAEPVDKVKANLDKLSPEDRALAEQQKVCPESGEPLGSMDVPIKVMVKGQPVFVCCGGCKEGVQKDPDATLKKVEELKAKNKTGK
jgi:outer membrane murein-binding lipoprotein Lpp